MDFLSFLNSAAKQYLSSKGKTHIIGHIDADGLAATAILAKTFKEINRDFTHSTIPQLTESFLKTIEEDIIFFVDCGAESIDLLKKLNKTIFILDHHPAKEDTPKNIIHCNPLLFNKDPTEISAAGVAYLFAKNLKQTKTAHIAIIGALADAQEKPEFKGLNKDILKDAINNKTIKIIKDLNLFGKSNRPLFKLLQYSTDMNIPTITNNRDACFEFIHELNLDPNQTYNQLTKEEKEALKNAIKNKGAENLEITIYQLTEPPSKDAKEMCTILNACGRLNKPELGVSILLGEKKEEIDNILTLYRKTITKALDWIRNNPQEKINKALIINAKNNINPNIAGTVASIFTRSKMVPPNTFVLSLARYPNNQTKVSLRHRGPPPKSLREILKNINPKDGLFGGHNNAAGALIPTEAEEEYILKFKEEIKKET